MGLGNFTLVSGARFNPFTFDELLKPALMATEAHNQLLDAYGELASLANVWEGLANEQTDPIAHALYKKYADDLKMQADTLARQGLTPTSRQDMINMKSRYASEITPIERAYNWRMQQILNLAEGRAKGVVFEGDAASTSLDDYLKNPTLIYQAADSNAGLTRVSNAALALARGLANALITGKLDTTTNALLQSSGYETDNVQKAIADAQRDLLGVINGTIPLDSGNPAANVVMQLLQDEARASTVDKWSNTSARNEYMYKIMPALYGLIGQHLISPIENKAATMQLSASISRQAKQNAYLDSINAKLALRGLRMGSDGKIREVSSGKEVSARDMALLNSPTSMLKDEGVIPAGGSGGGGQPKANKAYDRLNTVYFDGKATPLLTNDEITDAAKNNIPFKVKIRGGKAYFMENNKPVYYYDRSDNAIKTAVEDGDGEVVTKDKIKGGLYDGVRVTDLINLADAAIDNSGSENQYTYGIATEDKWFISDYKKLISLQNKSQDVTKGIQESNDLMNQLLMQSIYGGDTSVAPDIYDPNYLNAW